MPRPSLLLITGAPGSGKTTLATQLAHALGRVRLSRDDFKEHLWDAWTEQPELLAQVPHAHWGLYYAALHALLEAGVDVIAEGSVHRVRGAPEVERLRATADVRLLHCQTPVRSGTRGAGNAPRRRGTLPTRMKPASLSCRPTRTAGRVLKRLPRWGVRCCTWKPRRAMCPA